MGGSGWTTPPIGSYRFEDRVETPQLWLAPKLEEIWELSHSLAEDLIESALTLEIYAAQNVRLTRLGALY